MRRLLRGPDIEVIEGAKAISLDEAHSIASQHGRVEIGGVHGGGSAGINLNDTGAHYISVRCHRYPTPQQNLMECVRVATTLRTALENMP